MLRTILIIAEIIVVALLIKEVLKKEYIRGLGYYFRLRAMHKYVNKVYHRYQEYICDGEEFHYEDWLDPQALFQPDFDEDTKKMVIEECDNIMLLNMTLYILTDEIENVGFTDTVFRNLRRKFNKKYGKAFNTIRGIEKELNDIESFRQLLRMACKSA